MHALLPSAARIPTMNRPQHPLRRTANCPTGAPGTAARRPSILPVALLTTLLTGLASARLEAQRRGEVVDEGGKPIAGAHVRVEVVALARTSTLALDHTLDVLARAPLTGISTDTAGRFELNLTPAHRRLGTGFEPPLVLVIEARGFDPWREPLAFGLAGFRGTRAVLRRTTADAMHTVVVESAPEGGLLWVGRIDSAGSLAHEWIVPVPPDGRVSLHAPLVPTPLAFDDWRRTRALGHEVQLWAPGRSSERIPLDPRTRRVIIAQADTTTRALAVRTGGGPAVAVRGLYHCPDRVRRWFPLPADRAHEDRHLRLIAVTAQACATAVPDPGAHDEVHLAPLGTGEASIAITSQADAAVIARAQAWLMPLECWPPRSARAEGAPGCVELAVEGGAVRARLEDLQRHALVVAMPDHSTLFVPPVNHTEAPATLALQPARLVSPFVVAVDTSDRPVPGAEIRLPFAAQASLTPQTVSTLVTDGTGTCRLPPMAPRGNELVCVDDRRYGRLRLEREEGTAPATVLVHGVEVRASVRDRRGRPVAFASVKIESQTASGEPRTRRGFTDAAGEVLAAYVGETATLTCRGVTVAQRVAGDQENAPLDVEVTGQRACIVHLPAHARVQRVSHWTPDGEVQHETLDVATDRLLIAWPEDCVRCDIGLADGPPATILAADLEALDPLPVLARDRIVRTVRLHAFDGDQRPVHGFEIRPVFGRAALLVYDQREGSAARDGVHDGVWAARDDAAHELQILHREFLPSEPVRVSETEGAHEPALIVALTRGAAVTFRVARAHLPPPERDLTLTIEDGGKPRYLVTLRAPAPELDDEATVSVDLPLPFALPPGHYAATMRSGRNAVRMQFVVAGTTPVIVEGGG